jgi:hypothetical protein
MFAADLSNYTTALSPSALDVWKQHGFWLAIVQAVSPPAGYPAGKTREQIQQCLDAGLVIDAYVYLWFDLDASDIRSKLGLLDGLSIRRIWLDVEDQAASKYDQATTEQKVMDALTACESWSYNHGASEQVGIYTGAWFWTDQRYMSNTTTFSGRELWDANYETDAFAPYGGWTSRAIHQYQGTTSLGGISGIDLNVLSDGEAAKVQKILAGENPQPEPTAADFRQAMAYLYNDVIAPLGSYKYERIRKAVAETYRVAKQYGAVE